MVAGYLKIPQKELQDDGAMRRATANKIAESLFAQDTKKLQEGIEEYIKNSISFYDAGAEGLLIA